MTPELRSSAAHLLVDDVELPVLDDAATHHVFRVLRVRDGATVTVTDGRGRWRSCVAAAGAIEPTSAVTAIAPRARPVTLACAIPKQDRPEWIVQKSTELGVDRIVFVHADRSVVRWAADRATKHLAKLRRVAAEALQQSRGVWLPAVEGPVSSHQVLPGLIAAEPHAAPLADGVVSVAIGPEGGWSPEELAVAAATASIAAPVLRVATAAIVAAARLVQHAE